MGGRTAAFPSSPVMGYVLPDMCPWGDLEPKATFHGNTNKGAEPGKAWTPAEFRLAW